MSHENEQVSVTAAAGAKGSVDGVVMLDNIRLLSKKKNKINALPKGEGFHRAAVYFLAFTIA